MVFTMPSELVVVSFLTHLYSLCRAEEEKAPEAFHDLTDTDEAFPLDSEQLSLQLLEVNKQICQEAMPFFYSLDRFRCVDMNRTVRFLHKMSLRRIEHLTNLHLELTLGKSALDEQLGIFPTP